MIKFNPDTVLDLLDKLTSNVFTNEDYNNHYYIKLVEHCQNGIIESETRDMNNAINKYICDNWGDYRQEGERILNKRKQYWDDDYTAIKAIYDEIITLDSDYTIDKELSAQHKGERHE